MGDGEISRRAFLAASAATAGAAALPRLATAAVTATAPSDRAWRALERSLDGDVVRRGESGFRRASRLFNPRFDDVRPLAVVEAESADDVAEAIRFARRHGLRCRPKSGGHSYVGASTVDDGLVIDVGRLHRTRLDAASGIATVGAGAGLYSVHKVLAGHGRSIPTGTCPTVGATGLTLGGGLGVESRLHGLTCDALTRLTLVTADGRVRRVDRHHNRGLFWASRGGGGGNFGIVTQLRFQTHRVGPTGFFLMTFPWGRAPRVLRGWARRIEAMPRSVWANLHLEAFADGSTRVRVVGVCRAGDEDEQAAAMQRAIGVDATSVSTFRRSYLEGVQFLGGGTTSPRTGFAAGSDVLGGLPRRVADDLAGLVRARARSGHSAAVILDPLTGAVHDRAPGATAFRWRRQLASVQWYVGLPDDPSRRLLDATYDWIDRAHRVVRRPSVGSYVNYLEPRRRLAAYYGANLDRLGRIKADVDPSGFFRSHYTIR